MCTHPIDAYRLRSLTKNNKNTIVPKKSYDRKIILAKSDSEAKRLISDILDDDLKLPCGQCAECRLNYSREWATRCLLEAQEWKDNYFVTLTYDDEHLVFNDPVPTQWFTDVPGYGGYYEYAYDKEKRKDAFPISWQLPQGATLVKEHVSTFMKDVRRYFNYHFNHQNIRFYSCGEYGNLNLRPHYHLILFNFPVPDLQFFFSNFNGDAVYRSPLLEKIWGKGFVTVGKMTWQSAAYVARYMMKKQKGTGAEVYNQRVVEPEFSLMSRMPGIGKAYYEKHKDYIYEFDEINELGLNGPAKPCKYFDRLFDLNSPEAMKAIKAEREASAKRYEAERQSKSNLTEQEYYAVRERKFRNVEKCLPRNL